MRAVGKAGWIVAVFVALLGGAGPLCAQTMPSTLPTNLPDLQLIAAQGISISDIDAESMQLRIKNDPTDVVARARLLGFYLNKINMPQDRTPLIVWMIEHYPKNDICGSPFCFVNPMIDADGYKLAKQAWDKQIADHPKSARVLRNTAMFLQGNDFEQGEKLLKQAIELEPGNTDLLQDLGRYYLTQAMMQPAQKKELSQKALSTMESALKLVTDASDRFYCVSQLPQMALDAGDVDKAQTYARDLLGLAPQFPNDWNYGNAIFVGNLVLGQIALDKGDVQGADQYLLAAGRTPGSPQLDSFGPSMVLAQQLLAKGQSKAVLEYFELCRKFWSMGAAQLDQWTKDVHDGRTPDFGTNLGY